MKKIQLLFLTLALTLATTVMVSASTSYIILDSERMEFSAEPINRDGRLFYPLRELIENVGGTVEWNGNTQTAICRLDDSYAIFTIGQLSYSMADEVFEIDVAPFIEEGKTFLPLRSVYEAFGFDVGWDSELNVAVVTTGGSDKSDNKAVKDSPVHENKGTTIVETLVKNNFNPGLDIKEMEALKTALGVEFNINPEKYTESETNDTYYLLDLKEELSIEKYKAWPTFAKLDTNIGDVAVYTRMGEWYLYVDTGLAKDHEYYNDYIIRHPEIDFEGYRQYWFIHLGNPIPPTDRSLVLTDEQTEQIRDIIGVDFTVQKFWNKHSQIGKYYFLNLEDEIDIEKLNIKAWSSSGRFKIQSGTGDVFILDDIRDDKRYLYIDIGKRDNDGRDSHRKYYIIELK